MSSLFSLIKFDFDMGLRHWEIVLSLCIDVMTISLLTLRWHVATLSLFIRKTHSDLLDIAMFLQDQLDKYGMFLENKMMHLKCIQDGHVVTQ